METYTFTVGYVYVNDTPFGYSEHITTKEKIEAEIWNMILELWRTSEKEETIKFLEKNPRAERVVECNGFVKSTPTNEEITEEYNNFIKMLNEEKLPIFDEKVTMKFYDTTWAD